jgi:uncharacterized protein with von Willebrand factor type A (vWA) domain
MSADRLGRFVRSTEISPPGTVDELYWLGRVTLIGDREDLDTYDRVFGQVFRGLYDEADSRGDANAPAPAHQRPERDRATPQRSSGPTPGGHDAPAADEPPVAPEEQDQEEIEVDVPVASR